MKRIGIILTVLLVVLQLCGDEVLARPTTLQEAEKAVIGWLKASPQPLGAALGWQVVKVETYTDDWGNPLYYIVYLQPNGFVIVPADDLIEPIIGFVQDGFYDPSPANPLGALVTRDLNGRIESVRAAPQLQTKSFIDRSKKHQGKWNEFIGLADMSTQDIGILGISTIDDVRVAPLVQTSWSQTTCCSTSPLACYNYYTPPYYTGGDRKFNYPCGCVATALAQIMYYYKYPNTGIDTNSFTIKVNDVNQSRSTRGGDGAGGAYHWADMVLAPGCSTGDANREAIGALCYDAGVAISNRASDPCHPVQYTNYKYGNTEAFTHSAKVGLTSTFKYDNAIYGFNNGSNITDINGMVNSNLDAGLPVYLGINQSGTNGHAIVCDGYGYNIGTPYHHLNMGWSNSQTAWYNLPNINSSPTSYNTVYETIYNIYKLGDGEVFSGRVTDPCGNPISDVNVNEYVDTGGSFHVVITHHTNTKGIYAFYGVNSDSNIVVWADKTGYVFPGSTMIHTGHSSDLQPTSGNLWGVDIVCIGPDINTIAPTSGPPGTYMKIQGTHFGSSPGTVVFPGGYYGEQVQWSDTVILCRNPCPYSGNVIVRSPVGVDSNGVYFDATDPTTIYVDVNHTPDIENGTIEYPFSTVERGIYATTWTDTVVVKPGTYNENISLTGDWGITLTSIDPNDPNIVASTIINGVGNGAAVTFEYDTSVLTGFTITDGNSTVEPNVYGGGIYCYGQGEEIAPTISHCIIIRNSASSCGGGIYCCNSSPTISYCLIAGNLADWGGGIYCENEDEWFSPTINHCLIVGNSAYVAGGICLIGGSPVISHCDITSNNTDAEEGGGGGVLCGDSNVVVHHTILWADTAPYGPELLIYSYFNPSSLTIRYSDVQGGLAGVCQEGGSLYWDANSIIDADPLFVRDPNAGPDENWGSEDDDFGDLHLLEDSPCIDVGDPNLIPASDANTDIDGQPRIVGCRIDIGADEFIYLGDIEPDGDVDFADFAIFASHWLDTDCGKCSGADLTGNESVDFDDLAELTENWLKSLCKD
jgi:hypothetical protein